MTLSDSESGHIIFEQRIPVAGDRKVLDPDSCWRLPMPDMNTTISEVCDDPTTTCPGTPDL
jgi:hypothetical protein